MKFNEKFYLVMKTNVTLTAVDPILQQHYNNVIFSAETAIGTDFVIRFSGNITRCKILFNRSRKVAHLLTSLVTKCMILPCVMPPIVFTREESTAKFDFIFSCQRASYFLPRWSCCPRVITPQHPQLIPFPQTLTTVMQSYPLNQTFDNCFLTFAWSQLRILSSMRRRPHGENRPRFLSRTLSSCPWSFFHFPYQGKIDVVTDFFGQRCFKTSVIGWIVAYFLNI